MRKILEGMRSGDLADLVLPMLSVDEYVSKIDDTAIVIGFYVHDQSAAKELNRFIQKSPTPLIDTEVSPAPDQHGYYLVFVELMNDSQITHNIAAILDEVAPLTDIEEWQMRVRGLEGVQKFDTKVLNQRFTEMRNTANEADDEEPTQNEAASEPETEGHIIEFLTHSDLADAVIEGKELTLSAPGVRFVADIAGFGQEQVVFKACDLTESALSLNMRDVAGALRLARILGEDWSVSAMEDHLILQRQDTDSALVLRNAAFR
jgi:hypothetical protein